MEKQCCFPKCNEQIKEEVKKENSLGNLDFCSKNCKNKHLNYLRKVVTHIDGLQETIAGCEAALSNRRFELIEVFQPGDVHRYKYFEDGWKIVNCDILEIHKDLEKVKIRFICPVTENAVMLYVYPETLMYGVGVEPDGYSVMNTFSETTVIQSKEGE